jgi:hypothetical protein
MHPLVVGEHLCRAQAQRSKQQERMKLMMSRRVMLRKLVEGIAFLLAPVDKELASSLGPSKTHVKGLRSATLFVLWFVGDAVAQTLLVPS